MQQDQTAKELVEEISENGIGQHFYEQFEKGLKIDVAEFIRWQFTECSGNAAIDFLKGKF